jgi:hypothetical protein
MKHYNKVYISAGEYEFPQYILKKGCRLIDAAEEFAQENNGTHIFICPNYAVIRINKPGIGQEFTIWAK